MRTLEEAIEHAEYITNKYSDAVSVCWSVKDCKQLAAWLRELQERRKAPEIIRCSECAYFKDMAVTVGYCEKKMMYQYKDYFCKEAERRG